MLIRLEDTLRSIQLPTYSYLTNLTIQTLSAEDYKYYQCTGCIPNTRLMLNYHQGGESIYVPLEVKTFHDGYVDAQQLSAEVDRAIATLKEVTDAWQQSR